MANDRDSAGNKDRDLTLHPETYMYMQNIGKGGMITVFRGPTVVNQTGQDVPVIYNPATREYRSCSLQEAVRQCPRANEGDYVVLENPASDNAFPSNSTQQGRELLKGRKVIIPGPWGEALWPGQSATVIGGHRLRSNQYLVASVYNAEEAEKNWDLATVKVQTETNANKSDDPATAKQAVNISSTKSANRGLPKPDTFAVGTRIIIRGSDVSFYMPCTGIEVVRDKTNNEFVRDAVTLEQLEYCCLIDESGKKEYPSGPAVVFPRPTQEFDTDKKGRRKFKPIELNRINGVHLKVTAAFKGPDIENDLSKDREFKEGEELFVTGKTLSIYYPREELSIIEYGQGNKKHYSTAIPEGEARYVIHRETGKIETVVGPVMFLADPRHQIPVRRILSDRECSLMYPNNNEALSYNRELAATMAFSPSGRSGMVSEGDYRKSQVKKGRANALPASAYLASSSSLEVDEDSDDDVNEPSNVGGKNIVRGTKYNEPRTITFNTKYDGVPKVEVWPGYAVLILGAKGERRVVSGPDTILLNYDEKLGFMSLSTGKPKSTQNLYDTAYLCILNNQVGDIVPFESSDHVKGNVKISLRVNFEGEKNEEKLKWFSVDNYVKLLTDHVRSIIAGMAQKNTIADFKANYVDLIRDAILGVKENEAKRLGMFFDSNNMRVVEVEVLSLDLTDRTISQMLDEAQVKTVKSNIEIGILRKDLDSTREKERIEQAKAEANYQTTKLKNTLALQAAEDQIQLIVSRIKQELKSLEGEKAKTEAREDIVDLTEKSKLQRAKLVAEQAQSIESAQWAIKKEELFAATEAAVKRMEAAKDGLGEILVALGREDMIAKIAEATNITRWLSGDDLNTSIMSVLTAIPTLKEFFDKAENASNNRGKNRLKNQEPIPSNK